MFIKVRPNKDHNQYMFECERYSLQSRDESSPALHTPDMYAFPPLDFNEQDKEDYWERLRNEYPWEMWLWNKTELVSQLLLMDCIVYIMSSEGKTIDTLYM